MTNGKRWNDLEPVRSRGLLADAIRRTARNPMAMLGLTCILVFVVAAIFAPLVAPYDPLASSLADRLQPPSLRHVMGTDLQGRDEFSRVVFGARISLQVGALAVLIAFVLGGVVGAVAGGTGGLVDSGLMRVVDVLLAVPGILLAIAIIAWLDRGLPQIILAVAVSYAPMFARVLRSSLVVVRRMDYIIAARSLGAAPHRVLLRHMLPNSLTSMIVQAFLMLATATMDIAALGFLGLGPPDPRTPEWGGMLTDAIQYMRSAPYLIVFPGVAIVIISVGFNLLGDGLRESLDPRLRR